MLNKLLKRCMPWMDKGRWYHIHVTSDGIIYDDIFSHHTIDESTGNLYVYFKPEFHGNIVDVKLTFNCWNTSDPSESILYPTEIGTLNVNGEGQYIFGWNPLNGESYDIWLFIRPIKIIRNVGE